ncbi:MAG: prepilin-type N-terminal cleavage/methylation domain-containing protein [Burkholderiales bacterium]
MTRARAQAGFTLVELMVALTLFAILAGILFGSLRLAGRSADAGEEKAQASSGMRLASDYLREQLTSQHPQRMRKMLEFPIMFGGSADELRYTATLPGRVGVGGMWYYRLALSKVPGKDDTALVLERVMPDLDAPSMPSFSESERSVLADDIKSLKISYYGRDRGVSLDQAPTWRNQWEDTQILPVLIRIEVVPRRGDPWPTMVIAPRAAPEAGCRAWDAIRIQCVGA